MTVSEARYLTLCIELLVVLSPNGILVSLHLIVLMDFDLSALNSSSVGCNLFRSYLTCCFRVIALRSVRLWSDFQTAMLDVAHNSSGGHLMNACLYQQLSMG